MPLISLRCNISAIISVNNAFAGEASPSSCLSIPFSGKAIYIGAFPLEPDFMPLWCKLESKNSYISLCPCHAILSKWSDEIYELEIQFQPILPFPIPMIIHQERWGACIAGECGGWFAFELPDGERRVYEKSGICEYCVLNEKFVLLKYPERDVVIDRDLHTYFSCKTDSYSVKNDVLSVEFSPGGMDSYKITQQYSLKNMSLLESRISRSDDESPLALCRCFCESVRLDLKDEAMSFLTQSLKEEMNFEEIHDFLGCFDRIDAVKYTEIQQGSLALRYSLDKYNYHYMCYHFKTKKEAERLLIDDIEQI